MAFKWSKGAARSAKSFQDSISKANADRGLLSALLELIQSVAMKTDLRFLNLSDAPKDYGEPGSSVIVNNDGNGLTFEGLETIDSAPIKDVDFVGVGTESLLIDRTASFRSSAFEVVDTFTNLTARYDPYGFVQGGVITVPSGLGGVYHVEVWAHCSIYDDFSAGSVPDSSIRITAEKPAPGVDDTRVFLGGQWDLKPICGSRSVVSNRQDTPTNPTYLFSGSFTSGSYYVEVAAGDTFEWKVYTQPTATTSGTLDSSEIYFKAQVRRIGEFGNGS